MTDATYPIASVATDETKTQNARRLTDATVVRPRSARAAGVRRPRELERGGVVRCVEGGGDGRCHASQLRDAREDRGLANTHFERTA